MSRCSLPGTAARLCPRERAQREAQEALKKRQQELKRQRDREIQEEEEEQRAAEAAMGGMGGMPGKQGCVGSSENGAVGPWQGPGGLPQIKHDLTRTMLGVKKKPRSAIISHNPLLVPGCSIEN